MESDFDPSSDRVQKVKTVLTKERRIPRMPVAEALLSWFSPSERLILYLFAIVLGLSTLALVIGVNNLASVSIPVQGGTLTEGEVGPARFLNPLLTLSGPDEDISQLVYSGLMRARPDGTYVPDLASSYEISGDDTIYTFHLRPNATFHDGTPVTAADVLFTVALAQNPDFKSPRQADWVGVLVSSPDEHTIVFTLPHPYAPFIENATMGILPKHLWQDVSAEEFPFSPLNTQPVGSGPYRISKFVSDSTGAAVRYELTPFKSYTLGQAYLKRISFIFFANEGELIKAFNAGKIDAIAGVSPGDMPLITRDDVSLAKVALPRVFGVFFNQNHAAVLADASVRAALDAAIDKQQLVSSVLGGYGQVLDGPVPPGTSGDISPATPRPFTPGSASTLTASTMPNPEMIGDARAILERGGWSFLSAQADDEEAGSWTKKKETISLTLATADQPELVATANQLVEAWHALGIDVTLQVYPLSEFNTNVLRPRAYDMVLFGEVVGRSLDLFAFWHSSQRNDPGLNLAMYTNTHADALLSEARAETDAHARSKLYAEFDDVVREDEPAIFLFAPEFLYLLPKEIKGVQLGALTSSAERFLDAPGWYIDTTRVWSIFTDR